MTKSSAMKPDLYDIFPRLNLVWTEETPPPPEKPPPKKNDLVARYASDVSSLEDHQAINDIINA